MEALREILHFLSDGGHAIMAMIFLGIFFAGTANIIRAFRSKGTCKCEEEDEEVEE